jgi:hypothetical protein
MDIAVFDLQLLQNFFEIHLLEDPEFLDAGFCEGLPEDKEEPHPGHFGKTSSQDYQGLQSIYWPVSDTLC